MNTSTGDKCRKRVFIGSSVESLGLAYALQKSMEHAVDPTVWSQGTFSLTTSALQSLMRALSEFDDAIFVFAPNDVAIMRKDVVEITRDNVIFELGLFMGKLGPEHCFIVSPRDVPDFHIPTDLAGIGRATYKPDRKDGNVEAALGPAVFQILKQICG